MSGRVALRCGVPIATTAHRLAGNSLNVLLALLMRVPIQRCSRSPVHIRATASRNIGWLTPARVWRRAPELRPARVRWAEAARVCFGGSPSTPGVDSPVHRRPWAGHASAYPHPAVGVGRHGRCLVSVAGFREKRGPVHGPGAAHGRTVEPDTMERRIAACLTFEQETLRSGVRVEALRPLHCRFLSGHEIERAEFKPRWFRRSDAGRRGSRCPAGKPEPDTPVRK